MPTYPVVYEVVSYGTPPNGAWPIKVVETGQYQNVTSSALVRTGQGFLTGIFVASASATPQIELFDNTAITGTPMVATFTPVGATFYQIPAWFATGLYVRISGTVQSTVIWNQ